MRRFYLIGVGLFFVLMSFTDAVEKRKVSPNIFRLTWDNDVILGTDRDYSQGFSFEIMHRVLMQNPMNYFFINGYNRLWNKKAGFAVNQELFTPRKIDDYAIQYGDRPYAGALYFKSFLVAFSNERRALMRSEIDLGVVGPSSGAGSLQYKYHQVSKNTLPYGWVNQMRNVPIVNYNVQYQKGIFWRDAFMLKSVSALRVGTIYDDVASGMALRIGRFANFFQLGNLNDQNSLYDYRFFANASMNVRWVFYNALLQGGGLNKYQTYRVDESAIQHWVYDFKIGGGVAFKKFSVNLEINLNSSEIKNVQWHRYHRVQFSFAL